MKRSWRQAIVDWVHNQPEWLHHLRGHYVETRSYGFGTVRVRVCSCGDRWPQTEKTDRTHRPQRNVWPK